MTKSTPDKVAPLVLINDGPVSALNDDRLDLGGTALTDFGPHRGLTGLRELYLGGVPVTDAQVASLQQELPDLGISR